MNNDIIDNRRALDDIIFDELGLTSGEREAVIDLVEKRLAKVLIVKNC